MGLSEQLSLRDKDLRTLLDVFDRFPYVMRVRVFGSRSIGAAGRASDIDLAIAAAHASTLEWSNLCEALEEAPIIYKLDIVRETNELNPRLRDKIDRDGVVIFQR